MSSPRNPLLREYIKLLKSRRYRQIAQKIALEGPNLVREALKAGLIPLAVFFTQEYYDSGGGDWLDKLPPVVRQLILPESVFKSITDTETPQAVAAILPYSSEKTVQSLKTLPDLILILDRLQDPGNMGTIIRTSAAAGVGLVYYTSGSVDPFSPKVLRATTGNIFSLSLELTRDPGSLIKTLRKRGMQLIAGSAQSNLNYWSVDYRKPTALIIGNETDGISEQLQEAVDFNVSIPLAGSVDSLNAAVATGVILYEIIRQRSIRKS